MAFHLYEDTWETSTTTGTGNYSLGGAVNGWRAFSAQYANADTCWYSAYDGTNFEIGLGTYNSSGNTLSRTTIYRSTNSNAAVSWAAGTRNIVVAPLGVAMESIFTPGSAGYPKRTADNAWAYVADPLPVANGGTADTGTAWTAYTPTVAASSGTITTVGTTTGRFKTIGKTVFVEMDITITTNGTGASHVLATLPVNSANANYVIFGTEINVSGKSLQGFVGASGSVSQASIANFDNTYPASNGCRLVLSGVYESA